jgi:uncharacterized protein YnzC (UPF0291/DUF896 family)
MSHLTVQEVIERINETTAPAKAQRTNDDRIEDQADGPEVYIPRLNRLANFMFSG